MIGHVQVAAVPSRHEPDEGEVNYPAIFATLDRIGYAGFVGAEYRPRGRTEDGLGLGPALWRRAEIAIETNALPLSPGCHSRPSEIAAGRFSFATTAVIA